MSAAAPASTPRSVCPDCREQIFRPSRSGRGVVVKNKFLVFEPTSDGTLAPIIGCKCGSSLRIEKSGGLLLLFASSSPRVRS